MPEVGEAGEGGVFNPASNEAEATVIFKTNSPPVTQAAFSAAKAKVSLYVPVVLGAFRLKRNVPTAPGFTEASANRLTWEADSQVPGSKLLFLYFGP